MKKMMMTLCSYHVELKYYLDQKSLIKSYNNSSKSTSNNNNNGVLESLKYLPKKPPLFNNTFILLREFASSSFICFTTTVSFTFNWSSNSFKTNFKLDSK